MRLIDADDIQFITVPIAPLSVRDHVHYEKVVFKRGIENAPTVDAVPVIRCMDCKHYEEQDETIGTCLLTESGAHIKGYCAWAEREEE